MKKVEIYTDGACSGNPGPGGWGAILVYKGIEKVLSGGEKETTNNRMELKAALEAFLSLKEPCEVRYCSDSNYVIKGLSEWYPSWEQKGFKNVKNVDLWQELWKAIQCHQIEYIWVKGHNGHPYNERCDKLATTEAQKFN